MERRKNAIKRDQSGDIDDPLRAVLKAKVDPTAIQWVHLDDPNTHGSLQWLNLGQRLALGGALPVFDQLALVFRPLHYKPMRSRRE